MKKTCVYLRRAALGLPPTLAVAVMMVTATAAPQPSPSTAPPPDLFFDDFNGAKLDAAVWKVPALRPTETPVFEVKDGKLLVHYNTYKPDGSGQVTTYAPVMSSAARFGPGATGNRKGLEFEARLRVLEPPPGLNAAFFLQEEEKDSPDGPDEVDFELLTKERDKVWLNTYNGLKSGVWGSWAAPGDDYDMRQWNTYTVRWNEDNRVQWFINGREVRPFAAFNPPDEAMRLKFTYWKPQKEWDEAYHPQLDDKGVKTPAENVRFTMEVDWVRVRPLAAK